MQTAQHLSTPTLISIGKFHQHIYSVIFLRVHCRHNIAAICEQLGRYMKQSQVSGGVKSKSVGSLKEIGQGQKVAESLLETPEMTALSDAADQIAILKKEVSPGALLLHTPTPATS